MNVNGTVALVTGAARGIGRASAVALAEAGAAVVVVVDLDAVGLAATGELVRALGASSVEAAVDVSDLDELRGVFSNAVERWGRLDIVHNNAGIVCGAPDWPETDVVRAQTVVAVNLVAVIAGTRFAVDAMADGGGAIVNTASVVGLRPPFPDPVYAATKAGVIAFTQSCVGLAERGIRVNAVCPGLTDTEILRQTGSDGEPAAWMLPQMDNEKLDPADVAAVVLRLVRDDTRAGDFEVITPY